MRKHQSLPWRSIKRLVAFGTKSTLCLCGALAFSAQPALADGNRTFPLYGELAREQGVELPLPFGISAVYNRMEDKTRITGFSIENIGEIDRVSFTGSESETDVFNLRADLWLLPFLNVYVLGGYLTGSSTTTMSVSTPIPGRDFTVTLDEDYEGDNLGAGATLVYGKGKWVASLDINYTVTDLDIVDSDIDSLMVAPRVGYQLQLGNVPTIFHVGATYLDVDQTLTVVEQLPDSTDTLVTQLDVAGDKSWNTVVNGVFELSRHWHVLAEVGFNDRETYLLQLTYRY